ncbi:MAG: glycoside hydrolase family 43 protein [Propionicimonas sp.]|uniref:glycoside hydrolase family 43 protein n=1 Tax=Propionicimonas sp. TaxID=1955623 RepID=UPI003D10D62B
MPDGPAGSVPIVAGFFPDPSICRVDHTYYLAHSSFEYFPAVPLHASEDLVTWEPIGHVYTDPAHLDLSGSPSSGGVFAPTLRHHDGAFYLITSDVGSYGGGHLITRAPAATGPWSRPVRTGWAVGIDPDLFWDVDGTCHLTWSGEVDGAAGLLSAPVDPATGAQLGEVRRVWQGSGLAYPEGPHLFRRGDHYYLLIAEGGTERGHCVSVARATSLDGPWEACPGNPVLSHRSTTHPVQNTGHADLVQTPDGEWALCYLGARPRGATPGFHVNGRETFLAGVDWVDGWPVVDEGRYPVPAADHGFVDRFEQPALHPRWVSPRGLSTSLVTPGEPGIVLAPADADGFSGPVLCVRARDAAWTAWAEVRGEGGVPALQVHLATDYWAEVRRERDEAVAEVCVAGLRHELGRVAAPGGTGAAGSSAVLEVASVVPSSSGGPDDVVLRVRDDDGVVEVGRIDGRLLSTEVAGGFTGRTIGVRAVGGAVRVTGFGYSPES